MPLNDLTDEHWALLERVASQDDKCDADYPPTHWRRMSWAELMAVVKYIFCGEDCEEMLAQRVFPARVTSTRWNKRARLRLSGDSVLFHCTLWR